MQILPNDLSTKNSEGVVCVPRLSSVTICGLCKCGGLDYIKLTKREGIRSLGGTWTHCCIQHGEPTRTCCPAQGTLLSVTWQPGWEGSLGENGYMCIYGWVPLLSIQNHPNIVNRLYPGGSNPGLPHCRRFLYQLTNKGSPTIPQYKIKNSKGKKKKNSRTTHPVCLGSQPGGASVLSVIH